MNASIIKYESDVDEDDPVVLATQLYEMHGYQKALKTVGQYIDEAQNSSERFEWEKIAKELSSLSATDQEIRRTDLG